jgi:hypothetical protein
MEDAVQSINEVPYYVYDRWTMRRSQCAASCEQRHSVVGWFANRESCSDADLYTVCHVSSPGVPLWESPFC